MLAAFVIAADQLSKAWLVHFLPLYESREIIPGFFNLVHVTNAGAAFSMLADVDSPWRHYLFLGIGIAAVVGLTIGYILYRDQHPWYGPAFGLIAGGAAGNLIDRLRQGAVVDFLDVHIGSHHWPSFNVADSAICVGAALFIVITLVESRQIRKRNLQ